MSLRQGWAPRFKKHLDAPSIILTMPRGQHRGITANNNRIESLEIVYKKYSCAQRKLPHRVWPVQV